MKRHSSPCQRRAHVKRIEEPDEAENAQPDGDIDEDLAHICFSFFLFLPEQNWWFLLFLRVRLSISGHIPLPRPAHI